jgi:hypothetical protein
MNISIKSKFDQALTHVKREGIDNLVEWLHTTDFFDAPSSTAFHGNFEGGLLLHSVNVLEFALTNFNFLLKKRPDLEDLKESVIISALFHDVCKVDTYKKTEKWVKDNNNQWQKYMGYEVEDKFPFGHGEKSVYLVNQHIKLKPSEALAIRYHQGWMEVPSNGLTRYSFGSAFEEPLVKLIQTADVMATSIEETKDYKALAIKQ